MRRLRRFVGASGAERRLLVEALCALAVARATLVLVPYRRITAMLSRGAGRAGMAQPSSDLLQNIGRAVATVARHVPWRADCLPQAIAARALLQRRGIASVVHIGVARGGDDQLGGHAWLTVGDVVVAGGEQLQHFVEIQRLPAGDGRRA
jgi:hypothetical protein